jgi:hypothetical protein
MYTDLRHRAQKIYNASLPLQMDDSDASILYPTKLKFFIFSLYHSKKIILKIFIFFICPSSSQQPKKITILRQKTIGRGGHLPTLHLAIYASG